MIDLETLENAINSYGAIPPKEPLEIVILESLKELRAYKSGEYAIIYKKCPMCFDCPKNCPIEIKEKSNATSEN